MDKLINSWLNDVPKVPYELSSSLIYGGAELKGIKDFYIKKKEGKRMSYMDHFLSLKCADDVLRAVVPIKKGTKEISEAMALIRAIRPMVLKRPNYYRIVDLCAGNALTGVIAAHLLPVTQVIASDRKRPNKRYGAVNKFNYVERDITDSLWTTNSSTIPTIIVSSHPCCNLAKRVIQIYHANDCVKMLAMLPCCVDREELDRAKLSPVLRDKLGTYLSWCHLLAERAGGTLKEDRHCLSKCNGLVVAKKEA